jgi:hypothetical protein
VNYNWTFTNTTTGEQKTASGVYLDNFNLGSAGSWSIRLVIADINGKSSTVYQQVYIGASLVNGNT